jgi:hypothetical protein
MDPKPTVSKPQQLAAQLEVGDLVFICVGALPFRKIADSTRSWTNHVGIVLEVRGGQAIIGESRFPFSGRTSLSRFAARSSGRRVAVARLQRSPDPAQRERIAAAARKRRGVFYDTGFNLASRRQFCSRYVREVLLEATGNAVGEVESFATLLARNPDADLRFWQAWFFGRIPWSRRTVTPASLLASPQVRTVFDGVLR